MSIELYLEDEAATRQLGEDLALALLPGDLVRLSGDLGVGKSSLARALIRTACNNPDLEVSSPTYTLVQTYDDAQPQGPISHYDLFRTKKLEELEELGLDEAIDGGVALVEWPEKGGDMLSPDGLTVELFVVEQNKRKAIISGTKPVLSRVARSLGIRKFLDKNWCPDVRRRYLLGDASTRAYEMVSNYEAERILMNSPPAMDGPIIRDGKPYSQIAHLAEDVRSFVATSKMLSAGGFRSPAIYAEDLDSGFLLIEDLGNEGIICTNRIPVPEKYVAAVETLASIHQSNWQSSVKLDDGSMVAIPAYDRQAMMIEVDLLIQWYAPRISNSSLDRVQIDRFKTIWSELINQLDTCEKSLVLRDFHSPNILWQQGKTGSDRVGLIDFQDALIGPAAYDVASLTQDARVTVSSELEQQLVDAYVAERKKSYPSFDEGGFIQAYSIMACQRAMKVLGIFVRLDERDGKPQYLAHLPRIKTYLQRTLTHPALLDLKHWTEENLKF